MSRSPSPEPRPKKVTPFLCRVFVKTNGFHPIEAFTEPHALPLSDEYGVYVWKTSTLSTILASLYPSLPAALQHPATRFAFRAVYFDGRAFGDDRDRGVDKAPPRAWRSRELGRIDARDLVRQLGDIDNAKTLEEHHYPSGAYLCISALLPDALPAPQQRTMNIRQPGPLPPQAFPGRDGAPQDSWIDARRDAQPTRGGFGIRGRGAPRGGAGNGGGWGSRRSASPPARGAGERNGWANPRPLAAGEDSWGAVPKMDSADDGWGAKDSSVVGEPVRPDGW